MARKYAGHSRFAGRTGAPDDEDRRRPDGRVRRPRLGGARAGGRSAARGGDSERSINSPLGLLLGPDLPDLTPIGLLLLLTWVGALVWVIVSLATSRKSTPQAPVPYPYWSGPAPAGLG